MPILSPLRFYSYLASELGGIFDAEGNEGILFFNSVKFVKFIRLLAHNMNGGREYFFGDAAKICVSPIHRSAC